MAFLQYRDLHPRLLQKGRRLSDRPSGQFFQFELLLAFGNDDLHSPPGIDVGAGGGVLPDDDSFLEIEVQFGGGHHFEAQPFQHAFGPVAAQAGHRRHLDGFGSGRDDQFDQRTSWCRGIALGYLADHQTGPHRFVTGSSGLYPETLSCQLCFCPSLRGADHRWHPDLKGAGGDHHIDEPISPVGVTRGRVGADHETGDGIAGFRRFTDAEASLLQHLERLVPGQVHHVGNLESLHSGRGRLYRRLRPEITEQVPDADHHEGG